MQEKAPQDVPVKYIDTAKALAEVCETLLHKEEFAFDTEFDRFYREYGFKLSLLQIFDGETCFIIDPVKLKDLQNLWALFENDRISKVVYSCSEDIQILKVNDCVPKNIYDLQIAAKLCNHSATSLAGILNDEFGMEFDKGQQRSNWLRRPLSKDQLLYACNDVKCLLRLKHLLEKTAARRGVTAMIAEENVRCEQIKVSEYAVKLSVQQKRKYDAQHQKFLLELLLLRDEIAQQYNVPPGNIVSESNLEAVIENKNLFLQAPFAKGYSKTFVADEQNRKRFLAVVQHMPDQYEPRHTEKEEAPRGVVVKEETALDRKYALLYQEIVSAYGKDSGEFILRGFKKLISGDPRNVSKLSHYQKEIIDAACKKLGIDFNH